MCALVCPEPKGRGVLEMNWFIFLELKCFQLVTLEGEVKSRPSLRGMWGHDNGLNMGVKVHIFRHFFLFKERSSSSAYFLTSTHLHQPFVFYKLWFL